ncbi:MAG TPA: TIGR03560 family F420-dependent LLM class oxidoreductase [Dehalococcoidia bacterium]|nr:TIGR03560 family F420-dependent LLM class oxidoreductase [Dehalococcoidia bacterium]
MKFGAVPNQSGVTWAELLACWQELDQNSNFDVLWLMDHFVSGFGTEFGSGEPCMEGWTALAALAQATSRVKLGILVTGNVYREPSVLAKQATTVDHISGGRLIFGIGAGWHEYESKTFGLHLPSIKERLDRLDEAANLIKLLWTQEKPMFQGKYYRLEGPPYNPPNVQTPHPPILIGGGGEKRTLRIVARYADIANVQGSPEDIKRKFALLDQYAQEAGRDPKSIRRTVQIPLFLNDNPAFKERVLQGISAMRGGDVEEARKGILLGNVGEVKEQVAKFQEAGVEEMYLALWPRFIMPAVKAFSEEIIPAFK